MNAFDVAERNEWTTRLKNIKTAAERAAFLADLTREVALYEADKRAYGRGELRHGRRVPPEEWIGQPSAVVLREYERRLIQEHQNAAIARRPPQHVPAPYQPGVYRPFPPRPGPLFNWARECARILSVRR